MRKRIYGFACIVLGTAFLFGCAGEKLDLRVNARVDGQPASQAKIIVDGKEEGSTDANGVFSKIIKKKPGATVDITVAKEMPGYRVLPWKNSFLMKLPKNGVIDTYVFDADLSASRYVTLVVTDKGSPVKDAVISSDGKEAGKTNEKGEFIYEYKSLPAKGIDLQVTKSGYAPWRKTGTIEPGQKLDVALSKRVTLTIAALTEEYGQSNGIPGIGVSIGNKPVGKTDAKGVLVHSYSGEPGKRVQITLSAPGYIPASWKTSAVLEGEVSLQRYFHPTNPKPIRTGIYRFVGNTPGVDLKDVLAKTEESVSAHLFKNKCFREVPSRTLRSEVTRAKLKIDKILAKGWRDTSLRKTVDMIIMGSVSRDDKGYLIETKFYTSGGKMILSQLNRASSTGSINSAAREIAATIMERFPFEGTVISKEEGRYRINLGRSGYRISRGTEFILSALRLDKSGKIAQANVIGKLRTRKTDDTGSWAEVEDLKQGEKITIGDRVVRRMYRDDDEASKNSFILQTKGGVPPSVSPLGGVNVYLNEEWVGFTGMDGKLDIPIKIGKRYDIVLYRHGYQQVKDEVRIEKNRDTREFVLTVNNSIFKIDSLPSSAAVYVDDEKIGATPMLSGKLVGLGFHTVKVSAGGDYRDFEEVVEFARTVEDRTGGRKIVLQKDYLKIGERAEQKGDIQGAIQAYASTTKGHPDYSSAHNRLAQLYLDNMNDYDSAIREFENVLSLPENRELLYKQYAVAYMNTGHAYYEKGSELVQKDKDAAAHAFGKAIQNLQIAKQNTRFFPTNRYDEALHDTYYYLALAYHKLYLVTKKPALLSNANLTWREYFDFFPKKLEGNKAYEESRDAAQKYWDQIKSL
ncbi:MAG: PEGA domain-containing protein [Nitrospirota bacterium]